MLPTGGGQQWGTKRYSNITAHLAEDPPDHFREVAVSRDVRGTYYWSFVYDKAEQHDDETHKRRNKRQPGPLRDDGIAAFDLGIKTPAAGVNDQGRFYHIGGFKGYRYYNKQLDKIRSKRGQVQEEVPPVPFPLSGLQAGLRAEETQATHSQPHGV